MNDQIGQSKAICILGMHRSGTSTVARALNLLGVYLGEEVELLPPMDYNPEGIWERKDFNSLQERLLAAMRRTWDMGIPLPDRWQDSPEVKPFKDELISIIKTNFSGVPLWGWKDPRSTIFVDLWKEIFRELTIELFAVFVVRNPLDVARSLQRRDGFSFHKSFGIWFNYNISALQSIWKIPTVFVSYDRFLGDWETELRRVAGGLDIGWPSDYAALQDKMKSFVRSDLRHSVSTGEDLEKAGCPLPAIELYDTLLRLSAGSSVSEPSISESVGRLSSQFRAYADLFRSDVKERPALFCQLYIDTGSGFNEAHSMRKLVSVEDRQIEFDLSAYHEARGLRLDPLNDMVALKVEEITLIAQDGGVTHPVIKHHNALYTQEDTYIFSKENSHFQFDFPGIKRPSQLKVRLQYLATGDATCDSFLSLRDRELAEMKTIVSGRDQLLAGKDRQLIEKEHQLKRKEWQLTEKEHQIAEVNRQLSELAEMDRQLAAMQRQLADRDRLLADKVWQLDEEEKRVTALMNSLSWRITSPFRHVYDIVRRQGK
jgi:hypothetical protein